MKLRELIKEEVRNIIEAKNIKGLKADYEKAIKKEQELSSLMLMNLVKYKQAKSSGDEKAIAKFTKIAGQLSPKKKAATVAANKAYQSYEDKISGLHSDAELEITESGINEDRFGHPITAQTNQLYICIDKVIDMLSGREKIEVEKAKKAFMAVVMPAKETEEQK